MGTQRIPLFNLHLRCPVSETSDNNAAEKIAAMQTEEFFLERRNRADSDAFRRILSRSGGAEPAPDDIWEEN